MIKAAPLSPLQRVEAARARAGLSQKELCRKAGLAQNTLAQAKSSGLNLSIASLQAIAPVLGSTVSELLGEAPPAAVPTAAGGPRSGGQELPLSQLHPSPLNPRKTFDPEKLDELAASITENGILEPLMVRPRPAGGFWIIFGERRYRAAQISAKRDPIPLNEFMAPVIVRDMTDAEHLTIALVENSQREDVPPLEEAEAYAALQKLDPLKWTGGEIARAVGKSPRHVQIRLALLTRLDKTALDGMRAGKVTLAQARELMLVSKPDQVELAKQIVKGESMTAEQVRDDLSYKMIPVANAIFDVAKSGLEIHVADDKKKTRYFTDSTAFEKLQKAAVKELATKLGKEWKWVEVKEGYFSSYNYAGTSTDKAKAGVVIEIGNRGAVAVHKGLLARGERSGVTQKAAQASYDKQQRARRAREKAGEAMTAALTARLNEDFANVLRLFVLSSIASYNSGVPNINPSLSKDALTGPLKALQPHVRTIHSGSVTLDEWSKLDAAAAWAALAGVPSDKLKVVVHDMLLRGLRTETGKAGTWLIAEALGVKLEPKDDEAWRQSLKGKIKGITKPQLDIETAIARAPKGAPSSAKKAAE